MKAKRQVDGDGFARLQLERQRHDEGGLGVAFVVKRQLDGVVAGQRDAVDVARRLVHPEDFAGVHAQQLQHLRVEADLIFGNHVMRMGVENQLMDGPLVVIGPGGAQVSGQFALGHVEVKIEVVARQPVGKGGAGGGRGGEQGDDHHGPEEAGAHHVSILAGDRRRGASWVAPRRCGV